MHKTFEQHFLLESKNDCVKFALIPVYFRPPHKGHYAMLKHYNDLVGDNGKVIVFMDSTNGSNENDFPVQNAKEILEIYCKNLPNVIIAYAPKDPFTSIYGFGKTAYKVCGEKQPIVLFGCTKKSDEIAKCQKAKQFYEKHYSDIYVIDPTTTATNIGYAGETAISETDFQNATNDKEKVKAFLPEHLSDEDIEKVVELLDIN